MTSKEGNNEEQGLVPSKKRKKESDDDDDESKEESDDEESDDGDSLDLMKQFPKADEKNAPQKYVPRKASGGDVLQVLDTYVLEGCLCMNKQEDAQSPSAFFYAKFPQDHGIVAGRLDNIPPKRFSDEEAPTFFTAVLSKAHVYYEMWNGIVHRSGDQPGVNFHGTIVNFGINVAVAGREDVTPHNPFYVDNVHTFYTTADQEDERKSGLEGLPEGYEPFPKGSLALTLFFADENKSYASGHDAPVPVTFWFCSDTKDEACIPSDILTEIKQLPPSRHI